MAQQEVWGRVEPSVSGQATHFQSVEELVHFIVRPESLRDVETAATVFGKGGIIRQHKSGGAR